MSRFRRAPQSDDCLGIALVFERTTSADRTRFLKHPSGFELKFGEMLPYSSFIGKKVVKVADMMLFRDFPST
jgi:hypothetical protein